MIGVGSLSIIGVIVPIGIYLGKIMARPMLLLNGFFKIDGSRSN
jgi:hypothetical protein